MFLKNYTSICLSLAFTHNLCLVHRANAQGLRESSFDVEAAYLSKQWYMNSFFQGRLLHTRFELYANKFLNVEINQVIKIYSELKVIRQDVFLFKLDDFQVINNHLIFKNPKLIDQSINRFKQNGAENEIAELNLRGNSVKFESYLEHYLKFMVRHAVVEYNKNYPLSEHTINGNIRLLKRKDKNKVNLENLQLLFGKELAIYDYKNMPINSMNNIDPNKNDYKINVSLLNSSSLENIQNNFDKDEENGPIKYSNQDKIETEKVDFFGAKQNITLKDDINLRKSDSFREKEAFASRKVEEINLENSANLQETNSQPMNPEFNQGDTIVQNSDLTDKSFSETVKETPVDLPLTLDKNKSEKVPPIQQDLNSNQESNHEIESTFQKTSNETVSSLINRTNNINSSEKVINKNDTDNISLAMNESLTSASQTESFWQWAERNQGFIAASAIVGVTSLAVGSYFTYYYFKQTKELTNKLDQLTKELSTIKEQTSELNKQKKDSEKQQSSDGRSSPNELQRKYLEGMKKAQAEADAARKLQEEQKAHANGNAFFEKKETVFQQTEITNDANTNKLPVIENAGETNKLPVVENSDKSDTTSQSASFDSRVSPPRKREVEGIGDVLNTNVKKKLERPSVKNNNPAVNKLLIESAKRALPESEAKFIEAASVGLNKEFKDTGSVAMASSLPPETENEYDYEPSTVQSMNYPQTPTKSEASRQDFVPPSPSGDEVLQKETLGNAALSKKAQKRLARNVKSP